eukprot:gene4615-9167_t
MQKGLIRKQLRATNYDPTRLFESICNNSNDISANQLLQILSVTAEELYTAVQDIDDEIYSLQGAATVADNALINKLEGHHEQLMEVHNSINKAVSTFEKTSSGALRISDRLATAEGERSRIEKAQELMNYIKQLQSAPPSLFKQLENLVGEELHTQLPCDLSSKSWGEISTVCYNLNRILGDITTDEADMAQRNVQLLSDIVETELLSQFEQAVLDLMARPDANLNVNDVDVLSQNARDVTSWLFLFNGGAHVQRRFVFGIVQSRVPVEIVEQIKVMSPSSLLKMKQNTSKTAAAPPPSRRGFGLDLNLRLGQQQQRGGVPNIPSIGINSTATATALYQEDNTIGNGGGGDSVEELQDHLSKLFGGLSSLCIEQSRIISAVFPVHAVDKITRQLLLRIFNDPAFGLQTNIDALLRPRPPRPPLSAPDYLDILAMVREKLSALEGILLDCFGEHPSSSLLLSSSSGVVIKGTTGAIEDMNIAVDESDEAVIDRRRQHRAQLKFFIEEQVSQMFSQYQSDYITREITLLRQRFSEGLLDAVRDPNLIQMPAGPSMFPKLRHDRARNIHTLCRPGGGVATKGFITHIIHTAEEAVRRILIVSRDDKKLPIRVKDVYMMTHIFLTDNVLLPVALSTNIMLCRMASASLGNMLATVQSSASGQQLQPVASEYIVAIGALNEGKTKLKTSFDSYFAGPISVAPNALMVCKELRRKTFRSLNDSIRDCSRAWAWAQVTHIEHILYTMQSKTDFRPKAAPSSSTSSYGMAMYGSSSHEPSEACLAVAAVLKDSLQDALRELADTNVGELIWSPLAELFVGALISHIRRQKISPEGALLLVLDLDEYRKALDGPPPSYPSCPVPKDLILSVREASFVFMVPPEDVVKVVSEDLRHLDASVVMGLLCARDDYNVRGVPWARQLSASFPSYSISGPLFWEGKRHPHQLPQGPTSLRQGDHQVTSSMQASMSSMNLNLNTGSMLLLHTVFHPEDSGDETDSTDSGNMSGDNSVSDTTEDVSDNMTYVSSNTISIPGNRQQIGKNNNNNISVPVSAGLNLTSSALSQKMNSSQHPSRPEAEDSSNGTDPVASSSSSSNGTLRTNFSKHSGSLGKSVHSLFQSKPYK